MTEVNRGSAEQPPVTSLPTDEQSPFTPNELLTEQPTDTQDDASQSVVIPDIASISSTQPEQTSDTAPQEQTKHTKPKIAPEDNKPIENRPRRLSTLDPNLAQYLKEMGRIRLLTSDEEVKLAKLIERGVSAQIRLNAGEQNRDLQRAVRMGKRAKDDFIRANLRLVVSVARRYPLPPGMELLDIIQEGNLGLEHAVDKFDWKKGFKFSTYATWWIRQAILRSLDQKSTLVRMPGGERTRLREALHDASYDPDNMSREDRDAHNLAHPSSLDYSHEDDDSELINMLADPTSPDPEVLALQTLEDQALTDLLESVCTEKEIKILYLRHAEGLSCPKIGEEFGVTGEAIRRLIIRVHARIREHQTEYEF